VAFGVFIHKANSPYDDHPSQYYQFPRTYLKAARAISGSWVVFYEPVKVPDTRGYYAVARVRDIKLDPAVDERWRAIIDQGSYLEFPSSVAFRDAGKLVETGLLNANGKISGLAQRAIRPISAADFHAILDRGLLDEQDALLPRKGDLIDEDQTKTVRERSDLFDSLPEGPEERVVRQKLQNQTLRNRAFRKVVLQAYDETCAFTGMKFINGGGRAEVEAAHIRPVAANGPDAAANGIALSGTVHWMFDRGLLGLSDSNDILISRHVNDRDSIERLLKPSHHATVPSDPRARPNLQYVRWHRDFCFKT